MDYYFITMLFLLGLGLGWVGWRGILVRRPFAINDRWIWFFVVAFFSPTMFEALTFFIRKALAGEALSALLTPAIVTVFFASVFVIVWYLMGGFFFLGVSKDSFSDCLQKALNDSGIEYEQSLLKVHLKSEDADLLVSVQDWSGGGHLRITPASKRRKLIEIKKKMLEIFSQSRYPVNFFSFYMHLALAVFMCSLSLLALFKWVTFVY